MAKGSKKTGNESAPEIKQLLSAIGTLHTAVEDLRSVRDDEREIRESHERLNEVIENLGDAFYAIDDNDNFIYVNRRAEEWIGGVHGSLIGKNLWKSFPGSLSSKSQKMHGVAKRTRVEQHFKTEHLDSGTWFEVNIYPDKRGGLSCYFRDITDERRTNNASNLQSEQLTAIFESATDYAIFTMDESGIVSSWNKGSETIFGFAEKEIIGKSGKILFTPEDRLLGKPEEEMRTALKAGKAEDERWHLRKDGSRFFASGVMQPLRSEGARGFVKICRDQTEKLEGRAAIRARGMLQRLVEAQEEERQRIARDLHDNLGQHLTALRLKIEGLKANYGGGPAMMKAIDDAQVQAKRIDDEISFMTWELRPTALDNLGLRIALGNFVKEWSKNYGIEAEFHSARVRKSRLAADIEINLYRIAQEALNNVVKHADAKKVDVMLEYGKEDVVLIIEDNGTGFDVKAAERRSKRSNRLGLVGMRERAALLGGTLQIESARLKGSTVIARVPARVEENKPRSQRKK